MKKHTYLAKLFTAFATGMLVMTLFGSAFASSATDVIPNFTALKIGETSDPGTGELRSKGKITSEGLLVGAALVTSRVIPSAGTFAVVGDLDVDGDLTLGGSFVGDLDVDGDITGTDIGYYYTVNQAGSGDAGCTYCFNHAYCESGDIVASCQGVALSDDDGVARNSMTYASDDGTCTTMGYESASMFTQAICFSPDGEPSGGIGIVLSLAEFEIEMQAADFSSLNLQDVIDGYETEIASLELAISTYATDFTDLQNTVDALNSSFTTLNTAVTALDSWATTNYSRTYGTTSKLR